MRIKLFAVRSAAACAPADLRRGPLRSPPEVAGVAEGTLPGEVPRAEGLPVLRPALAAATRELELPLLALLGAVLEDAHGAHVGVAHDLVEPRLALAGLELAHRRGREEAEHRDGLHHRREEGNGVPASGSSSWGRDC